MKQIDAYFRNESNAESVKAELETLKVENVLVERVPENSKKDLTRIMRGIFKPDSKGDHDPQVLHVAVANEDFYKANKIIQESDGYISKE